MMELIEDMFARLMEMEGFEEWWETESRWDDWVEDMIAAWLNEEMVYDFFGELGWDMW